MKPKLSAVVSLSRHKYGHNPSHYPIKGIRFVLKHSQLWSKVFKVACIGMMVALACLILLFALALKPQAELFGGGKWWSWLLAVLAVFLEAAICAALLTVVAQSRCQTEVFVETMRIQGKWKEGEMHKQSICKDLSIFKKAFFVRVLTYPLNIIPVVGTAFYASINATFIGWDMMDRYFDAIALPGKLQRIEVFGEDKSECRALWSPSTYDQSSEYAQFGFMCAFLEATPMVGPIVFPLTNACAAALFASDIEECGGPSSRLLDISNANTSNYGGPQT